MDKKKTTKLNAEELEKRSAPFVTGPMEDTSGGGGGTPPQSARPEPDGVVSPPDPPQGPDGGPEPRMDRHQEIGTIEKGHGFRSR